MTRKAPEYIAKTPDLTCKRSRTPFSSAGISCARSAPPPDNFPRDATPPPPLPPAASIKQVPSVPAPVQLLLAIPLAAAKSCARLSLGRTKRAVADPYSKCQPEALSGKGTCTGKEQGARSKEPGGFHTDDKKNYFRHFVRGSGGEPGC